MQSKVQEAEVGDADPDDFEPDIEEYTDESEVALLHDTVGRYCPSQERKIANCRKLLEFLMIM